MSRIHAGSDSTLIAVASIPPRIWEQDKAVWKAWYVSLKARAASKQTYKRYIAEFYECINKSIREATPDDIKSYEFALQASGMAEATIKNHVAPLKAYWTFAQQQQAHSTNA